MSKTRDTGYINNVVKVSDTGNITFVSGSTTLLAISSSGAVTTTGVISGSNALSASYAATASFVTLAQTASFVANAQSSSNAVNAQTASSADNFLTRGTLTAQTIVVQTITSSVDFVTGSTKFGSQLDNTHQFTGSVSITGSLVISGSDLGLQNNGITINRTTSGEPYIFFRKDGVNRASIYGVAGGGLRVFDNNDVQVLTITSSFVGIGTSDPGQTLEVRSADGRGIRFKNSGSSDKRWDLVGSGNDLRVNETGVGAVMSFKAGGNIGIGTTNPLSSLDISSTNSGGVAQNLVIRNLAGGSASGNQGVGLYLLGDSGYTISNNSAAITVLTNTRGQVNGGSDLYFATNNNSNTSTTKMVIQSGGNVGIGTTAPLTRLHVTNVEVNPVSSAIQSDSKLVVSGTDGNIDLLSQDDNSTVSNAIGMGRYNTSTGAIIHKFGIVTWANTGAQGSNTGNKIGFHYGTNANAWDSTELMAINSGGSVTVPSQPAWSVGRSTQQSFTAGNPTTINWDQASGNECFIQGGVTLNGSNGRITVPVAGKYMVFSSIRTEDPGATYTTNLNFRKNGTTLLRYYVGGSVTSAGNYMYIETRPMIVNCAANDYLDFYFDSIAGNFAISPVSNTVARFGGFLMG